MALRKPLSLFKEPRNIWRDNLAAANYLSKDQTIKNVAVLKMLYFRVRRFRPEYEGDPSKLGGQETTAKLSSCFCNEANQLYDGCG